MANNNHLYKDKESRLNTLVGQITGISVNVSENRYEHWLTLTKVKAEFDHACTAQGHQVDIDAFYEWMELTYGVRLQRVEGMIGPEFSVVDEQKYLMYKLKFD